MEPRKNHWDSLKIGAAGPPIELDNGWLLVYHGVDANRIYRLGVAVLDKNNPRKILGRSEEPILEPQEKYEQVGQVPNVVFSCGSVIFDDKLMISYGAADTVICVAFYELSEILDLCI
jgi:predicted GH43/DUF377 family glycosyl hydrolase